MAFDPGQRGVPRPVRRDAARAGGKGGQDPVAGFNTAAATQVGRQWHAVPACELVPAVPSGDDLKAPGSSSLSAASRSITHATPPHDTGHREPGGQNQGAPLARAPVATERGRTD